MTHCTRNVQEFIHDTLYKNLFTEFLLSIVTKPLYYCVPQTNTDITTVELS